MAQNAFASLTAPSAVACQFSHIPHEFIPQPALAQSPCASAVTLYFLMDYGIHKTQR
ncbi:hypothetical protein [Chromatium okenii]|uniref:hypothetical protein n=1 Tax=Chromatium okenii TaxID=61644 RepID=UPI001558C240|nr:hypothetical protein [Chromatium okenii]MBV5307974.1 hypothetical protein [Chromatium okenii]